MVLWEAPVTGTIRAKKQDSPAKAVDIVDEVVCKLTYNAEHRQQAAPANRQVANVYW